MHPVGRRWATGAQDWPCKHRRLLGHRVEKMTLLPLGLERLSITYLGGKLVYVPILASKHRSKARAPLGEGGGASQHQAEAKKRGPGESSILSQPAQLAEGVDKMHPGIRTSHLARLAASWTSRVGGLAMPMPTNRHSARRRGKPSRKLDQTAVRIRTKPGRMPVIMTGLQSSPRRALSEPS